MGARERVLLARREEMVGKELLLDWGGLMVVRMCYFKDGDFRRIVFGKVRRRGRESSDNLLAAWKSSHTL